MENKSFHRSDGEVQEHLNLIAKAYLRGHTIRQIVKYVNDNSSRKTSMRTVHKDIKALIEEWRETRALEIGQAKIAELERINEVERTAWDAWEKSILMKTTTEKNSGGSNQSGGYNNEEKTVRVEETAGNPAFLRIVMDCVDKRCEILGLNSPLKLEGTGENGAITIIQLPDNGRS